MNPKTPRAQLEHIPPMTELLKHPQVLRWGQDHPLPLITHCLRRVLADLRQSLLKTDPATSDAMPDPTAELTLEKILERATLLLQQATSPQLRQAINATGIILHTGLGRAVFPPSVVDSALAELKHYTTLATDRDTGSRLERDELVEPLFTELTGAEAATLVNNNAAATMLVLAALAAQRQVIVSRGQLIEIGGSFRLPDVMAQSQAHLVEVGATNRTHLKDYRKAITPDTAAIMRVHPSNYRVIGFTSEVSASDLAKLAHDHGVLFIDDLGAGALVDLQPFGLPHEPTVQESLQAGADIVLFSGDKLIGASQAGIILGRKNLIQHLRKHPLMRAMRIDKTCLMILERTLHLFRNPNQLPHTHPTYRMICTPLSDLQTRAQTLLNTLAANAPHITATIHESVAYLGSGTLPTEAIPSRAVSVSLPNLSPTALARQLRLDQACIFARIENETVLLDMRTLTDNDLPTLAAALQRITP